MGHRWAQNVPDLIGGGTYATLASWILTPPGVYVLTNQFTNVRKVRAWVYLAGMDDPIFPLELNVDGRPEHFPYGFDVEPDSLT